MRNLNKPPRYNVASIQAQQTMGGDVMQADENGQYVEWRDYKRALDEIEMLKHTIKYWEIEAKTDNDRWLRCLEDNEKLKAEVERLTAMANECEHLHKGIYSLSLNVLQLKDEVERLRKAGDAMAKRTEFFQKRWDADELCQEVEAWNAAKEGKQS